MERCEGHDAMVTMVSAAREATEQHGRQLSKVFDLVRDIKTQVDQNVILDKTRADALLEMGDAIGEIDHKIENGLRNEVRHCTEQINDLLKCFNRRRKERDEAATRGLQGFVRRGWEEFKAKASFILVTTTFVLVAWFFFFTFTKIGIFNEGPVWLLRFLGVGG